MDTQTKDLYEALSRKDDMEHYPKIKVERIMNRGVESKRAYKRNFKETYQTYKQQGQSIYADWYKCLAFTLYGYGNWSNNDRKRNGSPLIRKVLIEK